MTMRYNIFDRSPLFPTLADVNQWRLCYDGGNAFREQFLTRRIAYEATANGGWKPNESESEPWQDFAERKSKTPIPTYAKREINKLKNKMVQRFADIIYRGGSDALKKAIKGEDKGVDNRNKSMNDFIGSDILPDMLVVGKIGVFVDFPENPGETLADLKANRARPFMYTYPVEEIHQLVRSDRGDSSDWKYVSFYDRTFEKGAAGETVEKCYYRAFWKDSIDGKVQYQRYNDTGVEDGPQRELPLTEIPFVLFDIGDSLIKDACSYQIQLLNLISNDTAYCLQANYPFMVRQRDKNNTGAFQSGSDDATVKAGEKKGLWYDKGLDAPQFIAPPSKPIEASIAMRQESKKEIAEIVTDSLQDVAGTTEGIGAGLSFIGSRLQLGVQRLFSHWAAYESVSPTARTVATVNVPEQWIQRPMLERIEECEKLAALQFSVPSTNAKKETAKFIVDTLGKDVYPLDKVDAIKKEIDSAAYCVGDPKTVLELKNAGVMSAETSALAVGCKADEAAKAKADQAERVALANAAQGAENANGRGNPDGKADPQQTQLDKEAGRNTDGKPTTEPPVRGEGKEESEDEKE